MRSSKIESVLPPLDTVFIPISSYMIHESCNYFRINYITQWLDGYGVPTDMHSHFGKRCRVEIFNRCSIKIHAPKRPVIHKILVNDDAHFGCAKHVYIEKNVLMDSRIFISNHNHGGYGGAAPHSPDMPPSARPLVCPLVIIGDRVWLGEMVSVLPGVTIGEGSIIGANSVVSRDIPPYTIAVGAPARPIKRFDTKSNTWQSLK